MRCIECSYLEKVIDRWSTYYVCKLEDPKFALNRTYLRKDANSPKWCKYTNAYKEAEIKA